MEAIKMYLDLIITPLEKEVKKQRLRVRKMRFSLTKEIEKEYLYKLESLLYIYYKEFENLVNNEIK